MNKFTLLFLCCLLSLFACNTASQEETTQEETTQEETTTKTAASQTEESTASTAVSQESTSTSPDVEGTSEDPGASEREIPLGAEQVTIWAGEYSGISINTEGNKVFGNYKDATGMDPKTKEPMFVCELNFQGTVTDLVGENQIKIYNEDKEEGTLTVVSEKELIIRFPSVPGGCANVNPDIMDLNTEMGMKITRK